MNVRQDFEKPNTKFTRQRQRQRQQRDTKELELYRTTKRLLAAVTGLLKSRRRVLTSFPPALRYPHSEVLLPLVPSLLLKKRNNHQTSNNTA